MFQVLLQYIILLQLQPKAEIHKNKEQLLLVQASLHQQYLIQVQ